MLIVAVAIGFSSHLGFPVKVTCHFSATVSARYISAPALQRMISQCQLLHRHDYQRGKVQRQQLSSRKQGAVIYSANKFSAIKYSAIKYSAVQFSVVKYSAIQYSAIKYSAVQFSVVKYSAIQYSAIQYSAIQ